MTSKYRKQHQDKPGFGVLDADLNQGILIVDEDLDNRRQMADMFIESGYNVIVTNSVANALNGVLKKTAQVVLLGTSFDDINAAELIPLFKQCNKKLSIILVAEDTSLPRIKKLRAEGIFYHALRPIDREDRSEIMQAVECAFNSMKRTQRAEQAYNEKYQYQPAEAIKVTAEKEISMKTKIANSALMMAILSATSAFAGGGTREDSSSLFVWIFLGFCALIIVVQVVPALLLFFGFAKGLSKNKVPEPETAKQR